MVKVKFEQIGNTLSLSLVGHSGYADIGKDIVCSACSILAYTVAQFVKEADESGYLKTPPTIKLESGNTAITCQPIDDLLIDIQNIYFFAEKGYELLAQNYPQNVELKQFGQPDEA